ncbi:aminotransferase class III-fold pyridoxal phosphate-dependent enzyme [Anaerostipes faecalis]|uniref:aminotransferase class III-fold pyridoxal phosphate-dependent enzyme n=1 Tax=Anaerostipes faecalis TaxID=2738446 RepID=UPI001C1E65E1|nr:aminotransferase class III-fold pyridoxal phosphate-dependent enzyme [Anaerostipes faecalis]
MSNLNRELTVAYDQKYNQHPWLPGNVDAIPIERAEGIYFYDFNGKKYFDMSSQLSCVNIGYGNKDVIEAIQKQVEILPYIAPAYASAPRSELAKMLVDLAPDNMKKVFFTCGGSDANEAAINMARTVTGRSKIFSRYRSYHGSTLGSGNLSGDPRRFSLENPSATGFIKFKDPYVYRSTVKFVNDQEASEYYLQKIEEQLAYEGPENVAAIFVESITGANGVIIPPDGYLQGLRKICDKYEILLVCDEVMAGFGRTGKMFAFENWDVKPDMITFAKGVTSSYVQLGGVIISDKVAEYYSDKVFQYGLTYSGHSLACAAGVACVNYYKKANLLENSRKVGKVLGEILEEIKQKHACVGDVRYIGLFAAVEFVKDKETKEPLVPYADKSGTMGKIVGLLKERGFATFGRENNINIAPPLIITEEELRTAMTIFDEVLDIVDKEFL